MFKVSVIIPVYNAEKFLAKAIDSALMQPETDEVILVEDASPDNCLEMCKDFSTRDKRIYLYTHPNNANLGAGESRNLGIRKAKNDFIAFLDADDYYLENRFALDKQLFDKDASIDGVYHAIEAYAADDIGEERKQRTGKHLTTVYNLIAPENLFYEMSPVGAKGYFHLNGLTIKKQALLDVGLFNPKLRLSQDTHMAIKLAAKCKLVSGNIKKPVALFALHEDNRSQNLNGIDRARPFLFKDLFRWGVKHNLEREKIYLLWQNYFSHCVKVNKLNAIERFFVLLKSFCLYPNLIRSISFRKKLLRTISKN